MKPALTAASLLLISALTLSAQDPSQPESREKTYSVLPGGTLDIRNKTFHVVEIRSEYPVQIAAGSCHAKSTAQWRCKFTDPADLFIRDLRPDSSDPTIRANTIVVTRSEGFAADQAPPPPPFDPASEPPAQAHESAAALLANPKTRIRSFTLQAHHAVTIANSIYTDFEIHSTSIMSVAIGDCFSEYIFKIECHGEAADIRLVDLRSPEQSGINVIVITASRP
jgi:hypothetical protein